MKYLAIDLGESKIGIATSDTKGIVAQPHSVISRKSDTKAISMISHVCEEERIELIVLGIPLSANEERQDRYRSFARKVEESTGLKVKFWDETFSTKQAQNMVAFSDRDPGRKATVQHRDDVAAAIILQEFLDNEALT